MEERTLKLAQESGYSSQHQMRYMMLHNIIVILAWHVVNLSRLVVGDDIVEPSSILTSVHRVIASSNASNTSKLTSSRIQRIVVNWIERWWSSGGARHGWHRGTWKNILSFDEKNISLKL